MNITTRTQFAAVISAQSAELAAIRRERDELREALRAIVECPDYRSIHTHEMNQARALLTRKGETRA